MEQNISINSISGIKYRGYVTVDIIKNGKIIKRLEKHNTATPILFNFIYDCLAGNYYKDARPSYVIPLVEDIESENPSYKLYNNIYTPITSIKVDKEESIISYKSLIGYNVLSDTSKSIAGLAFYSRANIDKDKSTDPIENESMYVIFDESFTPTGEADLLINWQIKIEDIGIIEDSDSE